MEGNFERAFDFVIGAEEGYTNDPDDPGGETKYGISKRSYPELDIKSITLEQAKGIYFEDYWNQTGCEELPFPMDVFAFDSAVNQGVGVARSLVKKAQSPCQFIVERIGLYVDLAQQTKYQKYFRGWTNRTVNLYRKFKEG